MSKISNFDFSHVILGSDLDLALVGQASLDGLLASGSDDLLTSLARKKKNKQEALALLVLFDNVTMPDFVYGNYHIPILEHQGILKIRREKSLLLRDFEGSGWHGKRDPHAFIRAVDRTVAVRPLVLEYLARREDDFVDNIASAIGHSRKETFNAIINFVHSHYLKDRDGLRSNPIYQKLPSDFVTEIRRRLNKETKSDGLNSVDAIIFGATHAGALLEQYGSMSNSLGCGVASNEFSGQSFLWNKRVEEQEDVEQLPKAFCIVRAALHDTGIFFPKIDGIKHALRLRKDANIKAFRQQLAFFQHTLFFGNRSDLSLAIKEVHRAAEALKRNTIVHRGLRWLTYASLPLSVAETLFKGSPIGSLSLTLFSIAATKYSDRVHERHRWVLFGR